VTIESDVAQLVTDVGTLVSDVTIQQSAVNDAVSNFAATTARVDALPLVENTSDLGKPISTAAQTESDTKQDTLVSGTGIKTINGGSLLGAGNITIATLSTVAMVMTYEQRSLLSDASHVGEELEGNTMIVEGIGALRWTFSDIADREPDDDETCFTGSNNDGQWLLYEPAYDLIQAHALVEKSFRNDFDEDENDRFAAYLVTQGIS
jgi:hypothetical protein